MKTPYHLSTIKQRARQSLLLLTTIGLLGTAPAVLQAATISEMLEQGVYSEETKGDLNAAVKIYQQVVAEAKQGEAVAAQALYRLGVCYYKQKKYDEASAAFEKLAKDYPGEKELVRLANEYLAGAMTLLPAPWADGEELRLAIKTSTGFELGFVRYAIRSDTMEGKQVWRLSSQLAAGAKQSSVVKVEADSFKPIHSRWRHSLLGDAEATYTSGQAVVKLLGKEEVKTSELESVCYDNEEVVQLIRRLPLAPDYKTTLRVFTSLGGGNIIPIEVKVTGLEQVETPAGSFTCHRIQLGLVNQTFWYSADEHRYLVKFDAGAITAELQGVAKRTATELQQQENESFDFSLGQAEGGVPTIENQNQQPPQNQAKLLILATAKLGKVPAAANWGDTLNSRNPSLPQVPKDTVFALNAAVAGRQLTEIPSDTVVYFETDKRGWNQVGGAEMLARKSMGVAVAYADGRALLVDPAERGKLRWKP